MTTNNIWELYHKELFQFIVSKVKDTEVANDLLQDSFIKIHTKLHTLQDPDKVKSWVFSIANFTMLDYFRSNKIESNGLEKIILFEEEKEDAHTEKDCLRGIIKSLPKKYRDPLFLSDIKGVKQIEIAKQLKLGLSATKSRIQRARKSIEQGYMDCCDLTKNDKGFLIGEIKEKKDCKVCS